MVHKRQISILFFITLCLSVSWSQTKKAGPVINDFGQVWNIENTDYKTNMNTPLKVVFDIMNSPESHQKVNASIETAARFLNMHAQAGIAPEKLKAVLVVHNAASKDVLTNTAYQSRYGQNNPNDALIKALLDAEVEIIFCGQSSVARGIPKEDTIEGVQLGLSAMTALIQLQNEGYQLIKF